MDIRPVKTREQFEQLADLAEQHKNEMDPYASPFRVYYHQIRNTWQNNNNYLFFLYMDAEEPVGYTILYANPTRVNNSIVVYDIFVTAAHRNKGAFEKLFRILYNIGKKHNYDRIEWRSDLTDDVWLHILHTKPSYRYIYEVEIDDWYSNNEEV